jgi:zinc and cadmium transporter
VTVGSSLLWIWPVLAGIVASSAALMGSGLILALGDRARRAAIWLLAYAIGTLLGAATLEMIPEALETGPPGRTMWLFLGGMLGFVAVERALRWRHPHEPHADRAHHPEMEPATALMILWGDALHNFIDGLVLGVSFGVSTEVGLAASIAIFAHEVPQEIGDFAILIGAGMSKRRAIALNYLAAVTVIPGALVAYFWASTSESVIPWLLPLAAGGFVYIALANLVPALHHRRGALAGALQMALIGAGVWTIWAIGHHHP